MSLIPSEEDNPSGLHQRYVVSKANGEPTDSEALYFVLRLDSYGDDPAHIRACREAAIAYWRYARDVPHLADMASELKSLVEICEDNWDAP